MQRTRSIACSDHEQRLSDPVGVQEYSCAPTRKDALIHSRMQMVLAVVVGLCSALVLSLYLVQPVQAQSGRTHVVQSGETLGQIAQRHGVSWEELARWNGITDASRIYVGQTLTLYAASGGQGWSNAPGQATWSESYTAPSSSSSGGGGHVVQAGETIVSIAQRYGTTAPQLVRANNLSRPPTITPGQTLIIPGGSNAGWGAGQPVQAQRTWDPPAPVAQASTAYAPEAPTQVGKVIVISISQQHLWAYENGRLVVQTPVTTGRPGANTPLGTYSILEKYSPYRFISPFPPGHEFYYDPVDSNYSLRITWEGHHIHDAPWRADFGQGTNTEHRNSLGQWATGSIGCVNVPTSAMAQLHAWAAVGTQVTIQQ
jgi:LysM repeat protein